MLQLQITTLLPLTLLVPWKKGQESLSQNSCVNHIIPLSAIYIIEKSLLKDHNCLFSSAQKMHFQIVEAFMTPPNIKHAFKLSRNVPFNYLQIHAGLKEYSHEQVKKLIWCLWIGYVMLNKTVLIFVFGIMFLWELRHLIRGCRNRHIAYKVLLKIRVMANVFFHLNYLLCLFSLALS